MIADVTDLVVYRNSLALLRPIYRLTKLIPKSHYKLKSQTISSAEAIPPLIAEGYGKKNSEKEFKRFLEMAMGSSDETITHLRVIGIVAETYMGIKAETCGALIAKYKVVSRQLHNLIKNWKKY